MHSIAVIPIGTVRSPRTDRTDFEWGAVALRGLEDFSHAEIVYFMHGIEFGPTGEVAQPA